VTKIAVLIPLDRVLHFGPVHLSLFPFFAGRTKDCTITLLCLSRRKFLGSVGRTVPCQSYGAQYCTAYRTVPALAEGGIQEKKERKIRPDRVGRREVSKLEGVSEVKERKRGVVSSIIIVSRLFILILIFVLFRWGFIG